MTSLRILDYNSKSKTQKSAPHFHRERTFHFHSYNALSSYARAAVIIAIA